MDQYLCYVYHLISVLDEHVTSAVGKKGRHGYFMDDFLYFVFIKDTF